MTQAEISELFSLFDRSSAHTMKIAMGDFSLELSRGAQPSAPPAANTAAPAPVRSQEPAPAQEEANYVRAPLVGTYYAAPGPDQPSFVRPGDRVSEGQTLCLIEAMKMMCEVTSPCACVIQEVIPENGALLEFDAPIFRYQVV